MSPIAKIFSPFRRAAAAFFKHDLALKRESDGLHIVLESKSPVAVTATEKPRNRKPGKGEREQAAGRKAAQEEQLILQQLKDLLDEVPETRATLRHLVVVEQALCKKGVRVLHKLPLEVLQRGLDQLESLVTNWSPAGLASLRSKMAVALLDREHTNPEAEADAYRTAAVIDRSAPMSEQPDVEEVSDDDALAAAYAAMGNLVPGPEDGPIEFQSELGSKSAKALALPVPRASESAGEIQIRVLHD
jgi:hypothetical protein